MNRHPEAAQRPKDPTFTVGSFASLTSPHYLARSRNDPSESCTEFAHVLSADDGLAHRPVERDLVVHRPDGAHEPRVGLDAAEVALDEELDDGPHDVSRRRRLEDRP